MNHVDTEMVCWTIVHEHTGIMLFNSDGSKRAGLSSPYFFLSHATFVYTMKNIRDTSSARLDPMAAPVIPNAGHPKWPKMSIQLNSTLDATITMELRVSVFV